MEALSGGHFSKMLLTLTARTKGTERIHLSGIVDFFGSRSIGSLLLFLALPMVLPIPAPGISVVFGVPLILISAQLLFGRRSLWLPVRLGNRTIGRSSLDSYVRRALPAIRKMEKLVRPRFSELTGRIAVRAVGAMCVLLALIITLPVPLGHLIPGTAISVMALGLIEGDGLLLAAGMLTGGVALLVVTFALIGVASLSHGLL